MASNVGMGAVKTLRAVGALLALAAAVAPAAASASVTQWYDEGLPIAEGKANAVSIASSGTLSVSLARRHVRPSLIRADCSAEGIEKVWNEPFEGRDETLSIAFRGCEPTTTESAEACPRPSVTSIALPWSSRLYGEEHPLLDEWSGVELDLACGSTDYGVFSGTLRPNQGDADEQCEGGGDDLDNELRFQPGSLSAPRPRLHNEVGELSVVGYYKLGTRGHGITGEVFPCKSRGLGE